ncbi:zf-H2C2 2 domain containing protein, partial [Asbolus verrucosus]
MFGCTISNILEEFIIIGAAANEYRCRKCNLKFLTNQLLQQHCRNSHAKEFLCQVCGRTFNRKFNFKLHSQVHSDELLYYCDVCKKHLRTYSELRSHRRRHKRGEFHCVDCNKIFATELLFNRHRDSLHKVHVCEICNKTFKLKGDLNFHRKIHDVNYKKLKCDFCDKMFGYEKSRKLHVKTAHEGARYLCETCGKEVSSIKSLRDHVKTHTGEKPFVCNYCGKCFSTRNYMSAHLR